MELLLKKYAELSESEFIQIVQLIKMSAEVNPEMVYKRLASSLQIGFIQDHSKIVATASIKIPELDYRETVWQKSNLDGQIYPIDFELGYMVIA